MQSSMCQSTLRAKGLLVMMSMLVVASLALVGCSNEQKPAESNQASDQTAAPIPVKIGTLATEDFLPLWAAEENNYFAEEGLQVEITQFQSAQELSTALASGAIDGAMTDIPVAATLTQGGTPMTIQWVTLGMEPSQGRFGIMVGPNSQVQSVSELAGVPVGVGSGTMLEYVMDRLMLDAGIPADQIVKEEEKKLPVRFQLVMEGQTAAGVFPASLLALGELQGGRVILDDTKGENLSQSIMAFRSDFVAKDGAQVTLDGLKRVWDRSVGDINASPEAYRSVLIGHANLADPLKQTYPIQTYPLAELPSAEMVNPVLDWMVQKTYLSSPMTYDAATGALVAGK